MGDQASELRATPFDVDEGAAQLGLVGTLGECFLESTAEPVLFPLNPKEVLNFLPSARARNLGVQEHAPHDFVPREAACACERLELSRVRIGQAHRDSMLEFSHLTSINIAIALSRNNRWCARANKPKALSASSSAARER